MGQLKIRYKESDIAVYRYGNGSQPVLCFHGYGEQGSSFSFLEKHAGNRYVFFALDLPWHGATRWRDGDLFEMQDLLAIIGLLSEQDERIKDAAEGLILLGFSLGGRVSLSLYEQWPQKIHKLVLLAPDGLKANFWYWLATQNTPGRSLFAFTMKQPGWFFGLLTLLNRFRLVNRSVVKFVRYYIENPHLREELYLRWSGLRTITPDLAHIKKLIRRHHTQVRLVYGRHDRIILPVRGEKFRRGIETWCTISVIPSGHQVLHEKHVADIMQALQQ